MEFPLRIELLEQSKAINASISMIRASFCVTLAPVENGIEAEFEVGVNLCGHLTLFDRQSSP